MTRRGHWDDKEIGTGMTRKEHWNDIIGATFMTPFFFLDPSSLGTGMTKIRRLLG